MPDLIEIEDIYELIERKGNLTEFYFKGYRCGVKVNEELMILCGYVAIPEDHSLFNKNSELYELKVHGGITFNELGYNCAGLSNKDNDKKLQWVGFDCGHFGDLIPGIGKVNENDELKDMRFVLNEIQGLVGQLEKKEYQNKIEDDSLANRLINRIKGLIK